MENNLNIEILNAINEKVFSLKNELANRKNTEIELSADSESYILILAHEEVISLIETKAKENSDHPIEILKWILHVKNVSKKLRDKAITQGDNFDIRKFQIVIDNIIDPIITLCLELFLKSGTSSNITSYVTNQCTSLNESQKDEIIPKKQFRQISCNATKEQIEYFFMILAKEINPITEKPYMEKDEVVKFMENNFTAFSKTYVPQYYKLKTEIKSTITYFIFQFYRKYDYDNINSKMKYVQLLIENFELFSKDNPISLRSNMTPSKISKDKNNVIDIDKYFPKKNNLSSQILID